MNAISASKYIKLISTQPTKYILRTISNKNREKFDFKNFSRNEKIFVAAMGLGLSTAIYFMKPFIEDSLDLNKSENKIGNLEHINFKTHCQLESSSLREKFNFIDKVAKKCGNAVVFIEIVDPRKMDPLTNEPLVISNGSGFIFREDGWILTNAHVVINKPQAIVYAKFLDGTSYKATVEDADMNIDLALLKINSDNRQFPALKFGKSTDVAVGEWVVALGSPLSLSHSVTAGVVSSVAREAEDLGLRNHSMRYIQTDASITFGNSGGPLVNLDGNVIGINNLRITAGISFAIPIDYAKKFLYRSLLTPQPVNLKKSPDKFLGIATITLSKSIIDEIIARKENIPKDFSQGVLIYKVINGTVAHKSGLYPGDIITHMNEMPILTASDIYTTYNSLNNGEFTINVLRKGEKKKITLKDTNSDD